MTTNAAAPDQRPGVVVERPELPPIRVQLMPRERQYQFDTDAVIRGRKVHAEISRY